MTKTIITLSFAALMAGVRAATPTTGNQNQATEVFLEGLNHSLSHNYLYSLVILTVVVFLYRGLVRLNNHVRHLASLSDNPGAQRYFASASPWTAWLKGHLLFAPLLHHRRASEIRFSKHFNLGTIPTRAQFIFIGFIIMFNIFACVYNVPWQSPELQVLPILRARTGTLSVVNLIPIVIMSTIKNPLINMLDISYDSFNLMHRWLGRVCILQGIAHTVAHCIAKIPKGGWKALGASIQASAFLWTGLIAVVGFAAILVQSPKLFRSLAYEFFLHSHIILVGLSFGGLWHHLEDFPQKAMLLAAIILWGGSRAWRFGTMFYRSCGKGGCKAVIETMPGDAMRIEFRTSRPWNFKSGQTLYLCIPSVGFWTSHPFSVAWSDFVEEDGKKMEMNGLHRSASTRTQFDEKRSPNATSPQEIAVELKGRQTFSLIVKKKDGFTSKLWNEAIKMNGKSLVKNALIEGPYGHAKSMSSYGTAVLFASGVGITHQMPYVRDIVDGYAEGTIATRKVTLVWVVPDTQCLEWVRPWMHEILNMDKRREVLKVFLYISKATLSAEIRSPSETVRMSRGRPDVMSILRRECQEGIGCVGVSVCAGGGLGDEVRRATRFMIGQGYNADLIEEFFGW